jgi:cytochrome P450
MSKLPPGPSVPSIVQLVQMSADPYGFLERAHTRYGDAFTMRLPGQEPTVFVCEPAAVRTLVTAGYQDTSRMSDALRFLLGDHAVIFLQDTVHKETRRLMLPPFHGEQMRAYGAEMARIADEMATRLQDGVERALHRDFQDVTLRVILRCVFGIVEEARLTTVARLFVEYVDAMMTPWVYGAGLILSGPRVRHLLRTLGEAVRRGKRPPSDLPLQAVADRLGAIDRTLFEEIARCRSLTEAERAARTDILSMLVAARFDDGAGLSDEALRDQLMLLLIGGHETTATTLAWVIDCALGAPGTIACMQREIDAVMGDGFDPAKVKLLTYVGAVVNETMRLRPIATAVSRRLKAELRVAGHTLPEGAVVSPCLYLVQRDPRVWTDPLAFKPDRFVTGKPSIHEFFPFGAGVWRCLGAQFAEYEMRVVLARLLARVDLAAVPGAKKTRPMQRGVTVAPSSLTVRARDRQRRAETASQVAHA